MSTKNNVRYRKVKQARKRRIPGLKWIAAALLFASAAWAFMEYGPSTQALRIARKDVPKAEEVPSIETTSMEPRVAQRLTQARDAVLQDLSSAEAWGRYGVVLDAHEIYDEAIQAYRVAYDLDPSDFRWPYFLSRVVKFQQGDDAPEIIELYEAAAKIHPEYAPLQIRLGDALLRQDRAEEARQAYEKAIRHDPSLWIAHRGLGQAAIQIGDADLAVRHLQKAASLRPDDGAAHAALARAYLLAGARAQADSSASTSRNLKQIHTFPDPATDEIGIAGISAATCLKRARELIGLGRFQEALDNLEITEEVIVDHPLVLLSMGACYEGLGQPERAIELYERSLAIEDKSPDLHERVGSVLMGQNKFPQAIAHFRRAIELADKPSTRAQLASALGHQGKLAEAVAEFDQAAAGGAQLDASAHNNWGSVLAQQGHYKEAIPHFREAARQNPRFANAYFNWGRALEDMGNPGEAIRVFQIAARFDPKSPAVRRINELTDNTQDSR